MMADTEFNEHLYKIYRSLISQYFGFEVGTIVMVSAEDSLPTRFRKQFGVDRVDPILDIYFNDMPGPGVWPDIIVLSGYGVDFDLVKECVDRYGGTAIYTTDTYFFHVCGGWSTWDDETIAYTTDVALEVGHDGLSWVNAMKRFEWPTLETYLNERVPKKAVGLDLPPTSFLSDNGYRVSKGGPSTKERQRILSICINKHGLAAVTRKLTGFILNSGPTCRSRAHKIWKSDLEWVEENFYAG